MSLNSSVKEVMHLSNEFVLVPQILSGMSGQEGTDDESDDEVCLDSTFKKNTSF